MTVKFKALFARLWRWCKESATIMWARLQYLGGLLGAAALAQLSGFDFRQLLTMNKYEAVKMLVAVVASGIITEIARRRTL